jgi:replicative DNA helicase
MDHQLHPETTPRLTLDQRYELLAHVLRLPSLFALAGPRLQAWFFHEADEPHLRIVWKTAKHVVDNYGPGLLSGDPAQARTVLQTEARAYAASYPLEMPPEYNPYIDEFFAWAYEGVAAGELHLGYGQELLKKFLHEREVVRPLSDFLRNAGENSITNLPAMIQHVRERQAAVDQLGGTLRSMAGDWGSFQTYLSTCRGRTMLGLRTGMPRLDERTLGLRGLIALGAMPGVGKTTLLLQLGLNVLRHNDDAIFLFVTLEMPRHALYARVLCNQAGLDWKTVMLGSAPFRGAPTGPLFLPDDQHKLTQAQAALHEGGLASRLFVLDPEALGPDLSAQTVLAYLEQAKAATQKARALVAIDYLQLLPSADLIDLEADRHRVQFLKDVLAGTRTAANPDGDPVFVISELRKPSGARRWHGQLSDLMGSARLAYALDAAFLFRRLGDEDAAEVHSFDWSAVGVPSPGEAAFAQAEVAPILLELVKGRDGFAQGSVALAFEYTKSRFTEVQRLPGHGGSAHHPAAGATPFPPPNGLPAPIAPQIDYEF